MANGSLARLFRRVLDALDYWLIQAQLWLADAVCRPEPRRRPRMSGIIHSLPEGGRRRMGRLFLTRLALGLAGLVIAKPASILLTGGQ